MSITRASRHHYTSINNTDLLWQYRPLLIVSLHMNITSHKTPNCRLAPVHPPSLSHAFSLTFLPRPQPITLLLSTHFKSYDFYLRRCIVGQCGRSSVILAPILAYP